MRRIHEPELKALVEAWSPLVRAALEELGSQVWPPLQQKRGLLRKPNLIPRCLVEGPVRRGHEVRWALSHTSQPSTFDAQGNLTKGQRAYWIVGLVTGELPHLWVEGAGRTDPIPADLDALRQALEKALAEGPCLNTFYGNKGPLSHRKS